MQESNQHTEKDYCFQITQPQVNGNQHDIDLYDDPNCKPDTDNRMEAHLSYFARNNALCVIDINSNSYPIPHSGLSGEACGDFSSAGEAQISFMDDLNKQITDINKGSSDTAKYALTSVRNSAVEYLANNPNSRDFTRK